MSSLAYITEAQLQASIAETARALGYLVYHSKDSRQSEPGFPDLVLVSNKPELRPRLIFIECKGAKGRLTKARVSRRTHRYLPGQQDWLDALGRCAETPVEVYLLRPIDIDKVEGILR